MPVLLSRTVDGALRFATKDTNGMYIRVLFALGATARQLHAGLEGRKLLPTVNNQASCAALPKGAGSYGVALFLMFT